MPSLAGQPALGNSLPLPSEAGMTSRQSWLPSVYVGDPNVSPDICAASTLTTKPSPRLLPYFKAGLLLVFCGCVR